MPLCFSRKFAHGGGGGGYGDAVWKGRCQDSPALHMPEPLSSTSAWTSSSAIVEFRELG